MLIILAVVIVFIFCYLYKDQLKVIYDSAKELNKLPGKKGYPILGNILEFMGSSEHVFRTITTFFRENSRNGISVLWMGPLPYVLVADPDIFESILKTPKNNTKGMLYKVIRPWLSDGLLTSSGDKWHRRRKMLTPGFHFNVLQNFLAVFNKESKCFVDSLKECVNSEIDVKPVIGQYTLNSICETAMGISLKDHHEEGEKYRGAVNEFGSVLVDRSVKIWLLIDTIYRFSETYLQEVRLVKILHEFSKQVISTRKKYFTGSSNSYDERNASSSFNKKQAMLDLLIKFQREGVNIDDEGIQEEVDTFVFEGHDTTAVSLCFTLMLLANYKECQEKIIEELTSVFGNDDRDPSNVDLQALKYLECCIKESLRLYPSVPKISRRLGEDIHLDNGLVIPKSSPQLILIYEMHRRADLYPDPEKFDPNRFLPENTINRHPYAFVPFSAGPRNCIGQKFAMMEMKCLISAILRRYTLEPVDTPADMECSLDLVLRTKNPIRVKFIPR